MPPRTQDWERIRAKYRLVSPPLADFVGLSFQYADSCLGYDDERRGDPALVSTVKLRQAGFHEFIDTEMMLRKWFRIFQEKRYLPPVSRPAIFIRPLPVVRSACRADGGGFTCNVGDVFDIFKISVVPGRLVRGLYPGYLALSLTRAPAPEPSTWAIMLAGFASLGFLTYRASGKTRAAV